MSMTGAMSAAISGMKTHMQALNVVGNNIANVNTYGYKAQRITFKESMYNTLSAGSGGTTVTGGLGDPGLGIAQPGRAGGALPGEAPQDVQIIEFGVFPAVAEGAGGGDDGIFQFHPCQIHRQVHHTISSL